MFLPGFRVFLCALRVLRGLKQARSEKPEARRMFLPGFCVFLCALRGLKQARSEKLDARRKFLPGFVYSSALSASSAV